MVLKKSFYIILVFSVVTGYIFFSGCHQTGNSTVREKISIPDEFTSYRPLFHYPPVSQGNTWVCWSFATTSFIESEMKRLGLTPVRLSVMFTVYHAFIEKITYFVQTKGKSRFYQGDLFNTVLDVYQKYGAVPDIIYPGTLRKDGSYNHTDLYRELHDFKDKLKADQNWNVTFAVKGIIKILDKHLGSPPSEFSYGGLKYTPKTFLKKVVKLPWKDYLMITSFMYASMNSFTDLRVPDNWKRDKRFFNVPLDLFYQGIRNSIKSGYSIAADIDTVGEPGKDPSKDVMIVPDFDIPLNYIDQRSREYRFNIGITKDEHLVHLVGYNRCNGEEWFLAKDTWPSSWDGFQKGYYFVHESYIKLKFLAYLVHKDGIPEIVDLLPSSDTQ
jgi:bleomycin hydrolase